MEPTIPQAVNKLVENNDLNRLIVVPVFIAPGVHTTRDIPTILGLLDNDSANGHSHSHSHDSDHSHGHSHEHHHHNHEKIEFDGEVLYTDPLGADSLIIEIINGRVEEKVKNS